MKGILVLLDGVGDSPCKILGDKTPLEAAKTPNLDFLAVRGELGYMYPVKPGFVPQSDEGILSIFGNNLSDSSRGQLEARGTSIKLEKGDLALRVNFATIDSLEKGNIKDRRAGRTLTDSEAEALGRALNKIDLPCEFFFEPTIQHRAALVLKGSFSDNLSGNDATYEEGKVRKSDKVCSFKALDDSAHYTVNILNEFMEKAFEVLDNHPVNRKRRKKGLLPANFLLARGAGVKEPKVKPYKNWLSVAYMPLEIGFSEVSDMKVFSFRYPKLKGLDSYDNLWEGLRKACKFSAKTLKKNYKKHDYAYIHIKETDLPGHDNKPLQKKLMIEYVDRTLFKFLRSFAPPNKIKVVVAGDHSTPCKLKAHSDDPVPVLFYDCGPPKLDLKSLSRVRSVSFWKKNLEAVEAEERRVKEENFQRMRFNEKNARHGKLGRMNGKDLFKKVGFSK